MGEGPRFQYPKEVWSPGGGWWPYPKKWRANTAMTLALIFVLSVPVAILSEKKMRSNIYFVCVTIKVTVGKPNRRIPWRPGLKPADEE
ncbi:hypothetical protein FGB62_19g051 [Gracilaria domingensis]|nr:hypothetical protein FGB62_19g051 [Gracilaria domingensis]